MDFRILSASTILSLSVCEITNAQHRELVREIWRDHREAADDAAREAYRNERDQW